MFCLLLSGCTLPLDAPPAVEQPLTVSDRRAYQPVASGWGTSFALTRDGSVYGWGLYDPTNPNSGTGHPTPVPVPGLSKQVAVSAGAGTGCSVGSDGYIRCWGANDVGQLGNGTTTASAQPVLVKAVENVTLTDMLEVQAGNEFACARRSTGTVYCWGYNGSHQLGYAGANSSVAVTVNGLPPAEAIGVSDNNACAVTRSATGNDVYCWGANYTGQLGTGNTNPVIGPIKVPNLTNPVAVAMGSDFACALGADGTVRCWGWIGETQQPYVFPLTPGLIPAPSGIGNWSGVRAISATAGTICGIGANGAVYCLGDNTEGQLGTGDTVGRSLPTPVQLATHLGYSSTPATHISVGLFTVCEQSADGNLWCWGRNSRGELGNGTMNAYTTVPTYNVIPRWLSAGPRLSTSGSHACITQSTNGTVKCFGDNVHGDLGNNSTTQAPTPVNAVGLTNMVTVVTGQSSAHSCGVRGDGTVYCWGYNAYGQLGNGTTTDSLVPVAVNGITTAVDVAVGAIATCALTSAGQVLCWGRGIWGQLGQGNTTSSSTPLPVALPSAATGIAVGGGHACALLANGNASCWGLNFYGEVGVGTSVIQYLTPQTISFSTGMVSISAGSENTCAVLTNGQLACWGANGTGQLGNNTTTLSTSPIVVSGLPKVAAVSAGPTTCALGTDGTVWCSGGNAYGQLGDGTSTDRHVFTHILPLSNVMQVSAGDRSSCALVADGSTYCWGQNLYGQLGNGTTTPSLVPTLTLVGP